FPPGAEPAPTVDGEIRIEL
ncbi:MAG: hypothetical protein ACK4F7_06215, partial [Inhella sp.]